MKKILNFLDTWGTLSITALVLIIFLKTCNTNTHITRGEKITNQRLDSITKAIYVLKREMQIEGLRVEKRMIQSTDRKILDVNRQSEIDKEIQNLSK